jgi:hypothetical protein
MKAKRVKASFAAAGGAGLSEGEIIPDNHPLVKQYPGLFEDVDDYFAREFPQLKESTSKRGGESVEQATAGPGEKRSVTTRRQTSARKSKGDDQ